MNDVNPEKKEVVMRSLAVAGLIALICLIAWLSVQIVKVAPAAFSSLASLAEGISQYEKSLTDVTEQKELFIHKELVVVGSGEEASLSWDDVAKTGSYTFSYGCVDGVTLAIRDTEGTRDIACDTNYDLKNATSVTVLVTSAKDHYVDVTYTVHYTEAGESAVASTGSAMITVTNKNANTPSSANGDEVVLGADDIETDGTAPSPETGSTDGNTAVGGGTTYEYEYKIPVSNPNGYTDLQTTFINVGRIVNGKFVAGELKQDAAGAVQFSVKNIGTRTSETWKFTITLPDGTTYTSETQAALKPNERATLTIGLQTDNDTTHTFTATVTTDRDRSLNNNSFSKKVAVVK